jgi:hypothetical protein
LISVASDRAGAAVVGTDRPCDTKNSSSDNTTRVIVADDAGRIGVDVLGTEKLVSI